MAGSAFHGQREHSTVIGNGQAECHHAGQLDGTSHLHALLFPSARTSKLETPSWFHSTAAVVESSLMMNSSTSDSGALMRSSCSRHRGRPSRDPLPPPAAEYAGARHCDPLPPTPQCGHPQRQNVAVFGIGTGLGLSNGIHRPSGVTNNSSRLPRGTRIKQNPASLETNTASLRRSMTR